MLSSLPKFKLYLPNLSNFKNCMKFSPLTVTSVRNNSTTQNVINDSKRDQSSYETSELVNEYLGLHFGQECYDDYIINHNNSELLKKAANYPQKCGKLLAQTAKQYNLSLNNSLDLGCAVGGSTFELSKHYKNKSIGVDLSSNFIKTANEIKDTGLANFSLKIEGNIHTQNIQINIDKLFGINENIRRNRIEFLIGNVCNMSDLVYKMNGIRFDGILMSNLLCRLSDPMECLNNLDLLLENKGIVCISSPYSWLQQFTDENKWLNGGEKVITKHMTHVLGYKLVESLNIPLIIRQHLRKYEYIVSNCLIFVKN